MGLTVEVRNVMPPHLEVVEHLEALHRVAVGELEVVHRLPSAAEPVEHNELSL